MPSTRPWLRDLLILGALMVLIVAAFIDVKNGGFLNYDDNLSVTANPPVQSGLSWQNARWAFTTEITGNYHPLTWLSLMLDSQLSRPEFGNPALVFHLTNLLLHVANACLVYLVLRAMTGSLWRSALVAALFALHPLRVESVAWISERKDVLSAFFGLLALLVYAFYVRRPGWRPYVLALLLYGLSLLSKSMLVTFPFLLLLLDYWPLGRWPSSAAPLQGAAPRRSASWLVLEKLPFLAFSAVISVVTFFAQRQTGSMRSVSDVSMAARLANIPVAYARYLGKMVWFQNLAVEYPYPSTTWPAIAVAASVLLLVTVTALVLWRVRRQPWQAVGWFWFLGMLVPVIGLVQVGLQSMADRYTYLPMIGILILVAWSLPARPMALPIGRLAAALATAVVLAVLCRFTQIQVGYWENSVTLMTHATEAGSGNYLAENNLAAALGAAGDIDGAIAHCGKAVEINPKSPVLHNDYGMAWMMAGNIPAAYEQFRQAVALDPKFPEALNNLAFILASPGPRHDLPAALKDYHQALAVQPHYADAQVNLGLALEDMGDRAGAIRSYQQALQDSPDHADAHFNLGLDLLQAGRSADAIHHLREAARLRPQNPKFQQALEQALKGAGVAGY